MTSHYVGLAVELKRGGAYVWGTVIAAQGDALTVRLENGSQVDARPDDDCGGDILNLHDVY